MELKVWVDGIQRIVCGVNDATTCQDVVYALAHATGQTGRFTLAERWRSNERTLAPQERPLRVLSKWGEYASDVQFILRRSPVTPKGSGNLSGSKDPHGFSPTGTPNAMPTSPPVSRGSSKSGAGRDAIKKSLTFSGSHLQGDSGTALPRDILERRDSHGVVPDPIDSLPSSSPAYEHSFLRDEQRPLSPSSSISSRLGSSVCSPSGSEHKMEHGYERIREEDPDMISSSYNSRASPRIQRDGYPPDNPSPSSFDSSGHDSQNSRFGHPTKMSPGVKTFSPPTSFSPSIVPPPSSSLKSTQPPPPSTGRQQTPPRLQRPPGGPPPYPGHSPKAVAGTLSPPPYRSPPTAKIQRPGPPNHVTPSPVNAQTVSEPAVRDPPKPRRSLYGNNKSPGNGSSSEPVPEDSGNNRFVSDSTNGFVSALGRGSRMTPEKMESNDVVKVVYDSRYRDLVRLVNFQRETLGNQQAQLTQFDAEIGYWEEKQREHNRQAELLELEVHRAEAAGREVDEEVTRLDQQRLEDDLELGHQQERTLRSELTLLRSKLSNCETELLQCKNKIRLLMDEVGDERRQLSRAEEDRRERERNLLNEVEDLQHQIKDKMDDYDAKVSNVSCQTLGEEVQELEGLISTKKQQVEELVREMKAVNLESLSIVPGDDAKHLEGILGGRPGSTRKMVGSPRQLENAVPTSKNPHGVWV